MKHSPGWTTRPQIEIQSSICIISGHLQSFDIHLILRLPYKENKVAFVVIVQMSIKRVDCDLPKVTK